ncbi:cytochrome c1 heme lyase-like protein [Saccharata proteae CBS 121410]|uniref:Holocytochrome c-type synthase n=1 Tax=Saccharata proteae CBS 121410 TaxID=1314787 RepID=A0A9P4HVH1_9PEZI|nr:cytochrome c1 heme lyase-like protein [Saccharata proteae CBS 121410]
MAAEDACPVDHKTRQAWLDQAKKAGSNTMSTTPPAHPPTASQTTSPTSAPLPSDGCDSTSLNQQPPTTASNILSSMTGGRLGTAREISTIPRAMPESTTTTTPSTHAPANNETESGASKSGNWIYPSEEMFFNAMRRKNFDPKAEDMQSIVPIHNAVNERAWKEIKEWERGRGSESCGGPKLVSFSGLSTKLTPKARFNTLLGYQAPFDRHDWVIDRCGSKVEYVIDFYAGKDEGRQGKSLNFYLDVRPKLNSWEGILTRAARSVGL